jgi:hypothetical protein
VLRKAGRCCKQGADGAGLCRCSDTRQLFSIDVGWRLDTTWRSRGALRPKLCDLRCPLENGGRRESRVPMTPAVVRTRCTRRTAGAPEHPAFPAQWFYGLCRALPGAEFLWPPSPTDWRSIEGPVGPDNLHQLDTSHGCQDHTVLPSAASSRQPPRPARMLPEEVSTEAFKRRPSARRVRSRKIRPANTSRVRRCRVHRNPSQRS